MAFDPVSGKLWEAQNGDDFTELNLVEQGTNLAGFKSWGRFRALPSSRPSKPARSFSACNRSQNATQAHIHLGGRGQNGPVVLFLLPFNPAGQNFQPGALIASGTVTAQM